jgi:glycosyltransferase 2 family protein
VSVEHAPRVPAGPLPLRGIRSYAGCLAADPELEQVLGVRRARGRPTSAQVLLVGIGVSISLVFAYIAVRDAHPRQTLHELRSIAYAWLLPALVLLIAAFLLRAVRWQSLFPAADRPSLRHVTPALFVGYLANILLPLRIGDAVAIVALTRRARRSVAETTATVLVQRAQDVLSLVLLLFLLLPWLPHVDWLRGAALIAVVLLVLLALAAGAVLRFGDRVLHVLLRPLRALPFVPREALDRAPAEFVRGLGGLLGPRIALVSFAWTTLSWLVLGVGFWFVLKASGIDLAPAAGVLVVIGIGLAMILPSPPAALGVFEGATVVVLSAYGVDASTALSYALVLHALNVLPLLAVGAALALSRRMASRERPAQSAFEP